MDGVINCPTTKELSVGSYLFNLFIGIIAGKYSYQILNEIILLLTIQMNFI